MNLQAPVCFITHDSGRDKNGLCYSAVADKSIFSERCGKFGTSLRVFWYHRGPVPKKYVGVERCVVSINFWIMLKSRKVNVKTRNLPSVLLGNNFCYRREIELHRFTFIGSDCQIIFTTLLSFRTCGVETRKDCMISKTATRRPGVRQQNVLSPHQVGS